jgi:superfamily II DNA/RNA helicase
MKLRRTRPLSPANELKRLLGTTAFSALSTRFPDFEIRSYQTLACKQVVATLRAAKNPLLLLDPGLGKTLVSQCSFLAYTRTINKSDAGPKCKGLVLVPSRLLRDQHARAASWFDTLDNVLNIDHSASRFPVRLRNAFSTASWIISTPKRLENALRRDYLLRKQLKQIHVCVVDEFDAQAAEDIDEDGEPIGRFSKAAEQLIGELKNSGTLFFCMSATQRTAAAAWLEAFELEQVAVPAELVGEYAAFVQLHPVRILDEVAVTADAAIDLVIIDTLRKIRKALTDEFLVNPEIDPDNLERQAARILAGERSTLYIPSLGMRVDVHHYPNLLALLARFMRANAERIFLYEGRLAEVLVDTYEKRARTEDGESVKVVSVSQVEYQVAPQRTNKITMLTGLINARRKEHGLVLVRHTDVNKFICGVLTEAGIVNVGMTGEMSDDKRRRALESFEKGTAHVLVINRQMGGRGFDLPTARFALFLSPKRSEETMWQEMLRIRSSRRDPKDVYVMYFDRTRETMKCDAFVEGARSRVNRYHITESIRAQRSRVTT